MWRHVLLAGMASLVAGGAHAADKVEWNMSTFGPPRAVTRGYEAVAEYLNEKTGGNFSITIHYAEAISPAKENLDGISLGAIDMAHFCTSYHPGKNPVGTVLDLPFLPIENRDVLVKTQQAFLGYEPFVEEMARWNAKPYFQSVLPLYEFMGVGKAPKRLEDWSGMRVRALGGIGDAMRKLGAVPTTVTAPEVYTALERSVVQAASFPFSYSFGSYRLHEISDWYTEGMQLGSVNCPIIINQQVYDELPAEYQTLLEEAIPIAYEAYDKAYAEADTKWVPIFKERLEVVKYSPEQLGEFRQRAAEPVWDEWVAANKDKFDAQAALDFVLNTAAKYQ
jgi:TRAP-type mannitol/chloroaromatic compound transport system substrate-binding protein